MSKEDKQAILNSKDSHDRDLSLNVFVMRVLRKYVIESSQKEREELTGVRGQGLQAEPPTTTTSSTSYTKLTPPLNTAMEGKSS